MKLCIITLVYLITALCQNKSHIKFSDKRVLNISMGNFLMLCYSMQALHSPTLYGDGAEVRGHGRVIGLTEGRAGDQDDGLVGDWVVTSHRHRGAIYLVHIHLRGRPENLLFLITLFIFIIYKKKAVTHNYVLFLFLYVLVLCYHIVNKFW